MCAGQRGLCSSSCPDEDLQGLLDSLNDRYLRAVVGQDAVVLTVGRLENIEGRLVGEDNTPPVLDRQVIVGFAEFQPPALQVLGQPGLQLELQLEAGLQIAVDSQLGDPVLLRRQFLSQCSREVVPFEGRLRHGVLGHLAYG